MMFHCRFLNKKAGSPSILALVLLASSAPAQAATVNVKSYGAVGNGVTDDTAAIQRAVNAVQGTGGTVVIPAGNYLVNPGYNTMGGRSAILITRPMTLQIDSGATLKAKTNSYPDFYVISVFSANNVKVTGAGTIQGDRATHIGSSHFGGFDIGVRRSTNITVEDVTVTDAIGDGIIIREYSSYTTIRHVTAKNNRRQGMSIISGNNLSVLNSTFANTIGVTPECGLDIEPDRGFTVDRVLIQNNSFINNDGCGISLTVAPADVSTTRVTNVTIDQNTVTSNGKSDGIWMWGTGININNVSGTRVTNNVVSSNYGQGIMLGYRNGSDIRPARSTTVSGNKIMRQLVTPGYQYSGGGVYLWSAPYSSVTNNSITDNATNGIIGWGGTRNGGDSTISISGNTLSGNGRTP